MKELAIVVEVLNERYSVDDVTLDALPSELMKVNIGGGWDPLGQIISWLWGEIYDSFTLLTSEVVSGFGSVTTWVSSVVSSAIGGISSIINSIFAKASSIYNVMTTIVSSISSLLSPITSVMSSFGSTLTTIYSTLQTVYNYITTIPSTISSGLTNMISTLSGYMSTIIATLSSTVSTIASTIASMSSAFASSFSSLSQVISTLSSSIVNAVTSSITSVGTTISETFKGVSDYLSNIGNVIASGFTQTYTFLQGINESLWSGLNSLRDWFIESLKGVIASMANMGILLTSFVTSIPGYFVDFYSWMEGGWEQFKTDVGKVFDESSVWVGDRMKNFTTSLNDVGFTLQGFVNPLTAMRIGFDKILESYMNFFASPLDAIQGFMEGASTWIKDDLYPLMTGAWTYLIEGSQSLIEGMFDVMKPLIGWFLKPAKKILDFGAEGFKALGSLFSAFLGEQVLRPLFKIPFEMSKEFGKMREAMEKGRTHEPLRSPELLLGNLGIALIDAFSIAYITSNAMKVIGDQMKTNVHLQIFSAGAEFDIDVGSLFKHMSYMIWKIPDIMLGSLGYGFGMWIMQPIGKLINSLVRNDMPVALPTLTHLIEITRRKMSSKDYLKFVKDIKWFMGLHGFADDIIDWQTKQYTDDGWAVTVKDRFMVDRKLPSSLLYELPTPTDMCRMMVRDIFGPPLLPFPNFEKAIAMRGMTSDTAKMYYLLHFKYPPLDKLWEFTCRTASGLAWVTEKPYYEEDLGAKPGKSPAELNSLQTTVEGLTKFLNTNINERLRFYAKWHDYAPFPYIKDYTSDMMINLDMMAQIPMRIDARWMYKWSIIPDISKDEKNPLSVWNVVLGRGLHPKWVEHITVAECMNAFAEERTHVRTGVMNAYEKGWMSEKMLYGQLGNLTTVDLLGKPRTIRYLDGEQKLLVLRAKYDRGYNVLNELWSDLKMGYDQNVFSTTTVMGTINGALDTIQKQIGVDLSLDDAFLKEWLEAHKPRRDLEVVRRIRYWMRIFIYRATQLAEGGENFKELVDEYAIHAHLTDGEIEIMQNLGKAFIDTFKKRQAMTVVQNMVYGKVKSGTWTKEEGIAKLIEAGMSQEDAEAYIEAKVKPRVVSSDKLISMMERIPIDPTLLKKKMDIEGVPLDEQALYIPFAVASEIEEEVRSLAGEYITDFVYGASTENELKTKLDKLATLDGKAQSDYGVAWLVMSPQERELRVEKAIIRKARKDTGDDGVAGKQMTAIQLSGATEHVPLPSGKLQETLSREGYPTDEKKIIVNQTIAKEISEEVGRLSTELVTDFAHAKLNEAGLKTALDDLATLGGTVPTILGIEWLILSPIERDLLISLAKLRKVRMGN